MEGLAIWFLIIYAIGSASLCSRIAQSKGLNAGAWAFGGFLLGPLAVIGAAGMADKKLQKALIRDPQD